VAAVAMAAACLLAIPSLAAAEPTTKVKVGNVSRAAPSDRRANLLVAVRYPVQMIGRRVRLAVYLSPGEGGRTRVLRQSVLLSAGPPRTPDKRRFVTFVHRVELGSGLTAKVGRGWQVAAKVEAKADVNRDGRPDFGSVDATAQPLRRAHRVAHICSSVPRRQTRPGEAIAIALPVCGARVHWHLTKRHPASHGHVRIRGGRLIYSPTPGFRGTDVVRLSSSSKVAPVVVTVGTAPADVVRAIGDSVTAGFGYFDGGEPMPFEDLLECKPGETFFDDACSSNSALRTNAATKIEYAPDYGLANNVSWAAQWANEHGVTDYENLAVSGSEPSDWAPGGQLYGTTQRIESEEPDYILMTMGANPLLSDMLFGAENMGCAVESDITGGYRKCIERAFDEVKLHQNLEALYRELVAKTTATIFLMQYHLAIPSTALAYSAAQIAEMGKLLNEEIAAVALQINARRLRVVTPPHFDVGVDISPVYPSRFSCSRLGYKVDGPSVQNDATQDELLALHPLSFCEGPVHGPPWVISGDTGIHPSAAGYEQMASQVPAPR
jgi:lysophospholipase L1-like esterase